MSTIAQRLASVREEIARAAARAGRDRRDVVLLAVSKTQPVSAIEEAYRAGQRDFGENYAQELAKKAQALTHLGDIRWHMIGHLQRNKVKLVTPHVRVVHTVDSEPLARELGKRAPGESHALSVLVQVNVAMEQQKAGCSLDDLETVLAAVEKEPSLKLAGLMTIPPQSDHPNDALPHFRALARLRDAHGGAARLPELSMGMSQDYPQAIEAGATLVRVGSSIFGARPAAP